MRATKLVIPEAITTNGWQFYESCRCQHILKYKFRHPDKANLELEWWVKYYQFRIMEKNKIKVPPTKIAELDSILKQL